MRPLGRREMMRTSAGALLAAGLWPARAAAEPANAFHFVQINDLHFTNDKCRPWFAKVAESIRKRPEKPAFVLACGDLTEDGTPAQLEPVRDILKGFGVPVYATPGNHDYKSPTDRKPYDELFPGRLSYSFDHAGWRFVGLDSTDGQKFEKVAVGADALKWLDGERPKWDAKQPTVLFSHFPFGPGVKYRLTNADAVLERFKGLNLRAAFGGHYHAATEKGVNGVTITTGKCCSFAKGNHDGTKEKGYLVCHAKADGTVARAFVEVG